MSEHLGGSRGKQNGSGQTTPLSQTMRQQQGGMAMSARGSPFSGSMAGRQGSGAMRPSSAPRERPSPQAQKAALMSDARVRVEELRQIREAEYWGRDAPPQRDLPPYWSIRAHGQPYNDERLFHGATNVYQVINPAGLRSAPKKPVGPATEQQALLRKSLTESQLMVNTKDLGPLPYGSRPNPLGEPERILILSKLTPYQRIHALRLCLDRNTRSKDFVPWTQMVWDRLNASFWRRNRNMAIRLATQRLETCMKRHLHFLAEQKCSDARAPASRPKDVMREAFWRVDPDRTGRVSLQQFLQVWQNVLCLLEYRDEVVSTATGRSRVVLVPSKRILIDLPMCAAIFTQYGFDKDGLMPYVVFANAISASPSRLLGQEVVIDAAHEGRHGLSSNIDIAYCMGNAKITYPKCAKGVFPPSDFDPESAHRSQMPPNAHMWLEHAYGYAGSDSLAPNVFYTHNTRKGHEEVVYYVGCVGIVHCKQDQDEGTRSQRFFFGHSNDIKCLAIHPSREFVVTGQQKMTGPDEVPYACVWDVDNCNLVQRLDHDESERAVIACCFSGNVNHPNKEKQGGDLLVTITADDKHTIHLWDWMKTTDKYIKSRNIPGWFIGPHKKLEGIKTAAARTLEGIFYQNPALHDESANADVRKLLEPLSEEEIIVHFEELKNKPQPRHPIIEDVIGEDNDVVEDWELGYCDQVPKMKDDGTWEKIMEYPACNGTPPMVYGVVWNPLKPQDGRRGSEFATYGVKHLKTWIVDEEGVWRGSAGSFGTAHIENVLSACYVPAMHYLAAPGDSCLLTGFACGQIGLWVPPYPTRSGATYRLVRRFEAHAPGKPRTLNDGTQTCKGVRVIKLEADPAKKKPNGRRVLTGGSDGCVLQWTLIEVDGVRKDGTPIRGVNMSCLAEDPEETTGPGRFKLQPELTNYDMTHVPSITALDSHPDLPDGQFMAGTDQNDIWEVDKDPRVLVEGHEETVEHVDCHPWDSNIFVTGCRSGKVRIWDMKSRLVRKEANVGFPVDGCAFANELYPSKAKQGKKTLHVALGSVGPYSLGDRHKIAILDADTLQPLKVAPEPTAQVQELVYSPANGPGILAAGCCDMTVYLFNAKHEYQLISKCIGHSGNVEHIDWSYPISVPGSRIHGQMIIQAADTSGNLLYWDPKTGKKIVHNQHDAPWATYTSDIGFPVMGIWPDDSDRTDINASCRSKRGAATFVPPEDPQGATKNDWAASSLPAKEEECADGVRGCGYLVTGDDFSSVRLFNYPVVWDDAPYKAFRGHASHVMDVRFNCNDRRVVSVGGLDKAIFQWRTAGINLEDAEKDKKLLAVWQYAIRHRGEQASMAQVKPGVEWGQLDSEGKVFGPKAVSNVVQEEINRQVFERQMTRQMTRSGEKMFGSPSRALERAATKASRPASAQPPSSPSPQPPPSTISPSKQLLKSMSMRVGGPGGGGNQRYGGSSVDSPPPTPGAVRRVRAL